MFKKKLKVKLGTWVFSVLENTLFGVAARVRNSLIEIVEAIPDASARLLLALCGLLFIVVVAAAGAVVIPLSLIYVFIQLLGTENKELVLGIAFFLLGVFYLTASFLILQIIAKTVKKELEKVTKNTIKRIGK
jgi:hypothetical protein